MLESISHGDVSELRFSTARSRSVGYGVSAFVTRGTLIDTAFPGVRADLEAWLAVNSIAGALLTHAHEDHAGNAAALAASGLPIGLAALTRDALRSPERIGFYRQFTWGGAAALDAPVAGFRHPNLALHPTPGHSADHHVVWDAERGTVFGGDLFIGVKVRIAHHDEDLNAQVRALREVASWQPERFFDAHRGRIEDPVMQLRAKADWMEATIDAVARRVRDGWSDGAIRREVFGGEELAGYFSLGDYSRLNFVRSVRQSVARSRGSTKAAPSE